MQSKARELGAKIHDAGSKAKRKAVAAGKAVNAVANPIAKAVKAVIDGAKDYMMIVHVKKLSLVLHSLNFVIYSSNVLHQQQLLH